MTLIGVPGEHVGANSAAVHGGRAWAEWAVAAGLFVFAIGAFWTRNAAPRIREQRDEFRVCRGCERVYWKGSHYDAMLRFLDAAVVDARRPPSERIQRGEGNQ